MPINLKSKNDTNWNWKVKNCPKSLLENLSKIKCLNLSVELSQLRKKNGFSAPSVIGDMSASMVSLPTTEVETLAKLGFFCWSAKCSDDHYQQSPTYRHDTQYNVWSQATLSHIETTPSRYALRPKKSHE